MPGKIKVKVLAGRNLPVMDRASDTTDAFVEIKFGGVTHKTDVCRKSLNPHWNSTEWYRFEVDESELQDEPLQLRLMDHDTYSANDAIGKVVISLAPLLAREANNAKSTTTPHGGAVMSGWIPVFDTMHGIRGELNVIVKVELFSDFNKYKTSSCGVQFFHCPTIPPGYRATSIHGFVEELVMNDDPEYQWIDKIRTPRASNEARQVAFIKLSNQVQRLIGLKAAELGANAVVGYQQDFDLEGEAGVVARAIGTAVSMTPIPMPSQPINMPPCTQHSFLHGLLCPSANLNRQLKKYLDILATDNENLTDLNIYYQTHQEELQKMLVILNPNASAMLDETDALDDDEKSLDCRRQSSITSYTGSGSIFQDEYYHHRNLRHLTEDQTDLNRLLNRDSDDSDSSGPLQKIKNLKTHFFAKRFTTRSKKSDKQDDSISLKSNSSETSRLSLVDLKNEFKKLKRFKKPTFLKPVVVNKDDQGEGMASILARSVIHAQTSLACISETQDSEQSPGSTLRRTSESEPTINISDDENPTINKEADGSNKSDKTLPEIHFTSLSNINAEDAKPSRQRKISESCPATPMPSRSENLTLPGEDNYFGSISSALSAESSELETSTDGEDESSDLKTDTDKSIETTSSIVHSVLSQERDPTVIANMDRKLNVVEIASPDQNFKANEIQQGLDKKIELEQQIFDNQLLIDKCKSLETIQVQVPSKNDLKEKLIKSNEASTTSVKDDTCVTKSNSHHFKFHNPFSHKKHSKSISEPSSPVEKSSFVYRSSQRIKRQLSKLSNSTMIKSISHYSLHPKKKETKMPLSQPGSSTDIKSKAPSDTVLGSTFLSYNDLLSLDRESRDNNILHKSDEFNRAKVSMYIGSEPVSRASLSASMFSHHKEESHDHSKKSSKGSKSTGLVHTAMETMLLDRVQNLMVPGSPDCHSKETKQFFADVNEKLGEVAKDRYKAERKESFQRKLVPIPLKISKVPPVSTKPIIVSTIYKKDKNSGLVKTAMETMLMDRVQSVLVPSTPGSPKPELVFTDFDSSEKHDLPKSKLKKPLNLIHSLLTSKSSEPSSPTEKYFNNKKKKEQVESTGLVHTAMETMLMEKVQAVLGPETPEPTYFNVFDSPVIPKPKIENDELKESGLVHSAVESMERMNASALGAGVPNPVIIENVDSKPTKPKEEFSSGLTHTAMETILMDKVNSLVGQPGATFVEPKTYAEVSEALKASREDLTSKEHVISAVETITSDKAYASELDALVPSNPVILNNSTDGKCNEQLHKETILMKKVHSLVDKPGMTYVEPKFFTNTISESVEHLNDDLKSPGLVQTVVQTILLDNVKPLEKHSDVIDDEFKNDKGFSANYSDGNIESLGLVNRESEPIINRAEPRAENEDHKPKNGQTTGIINTEMNTVVIDKVQSACVKDIDGDDATGKIGVKRTKSKKLTRQDSIHSVTENEPPKMSDNLNTSPYQVTRTPVHPTLGVLETIPSLPEGSLDHDFVEETNISVCDNTHAVCRSNRSERERRTEDKCDKDKGSPRHARHESYGGRDPPPSHAQNSSLNAPSTPMGIHRRSSDSDLSVTPKGSSLTTSAVNVGSGGGAILRPSMNSNNLDMLEYPFLTMTEYPPGFIVHIGGTVCARSVKLAEGGEGAARAAWWAELRTELRAHARALRCNAVIAYSDTAAICEDVCVLSASGTAAVINLDCGFNAESDNMITVNAGSRNAMDELESESCSMAHVPYSPGSGPYRAELSTCGGCRRARVPTVLLATCAKPNKLTSQAKAVTLTAVASRVRRAPPTSEPGARDISDQLPFLEYELHKLLLAKLRMQGANALFSLQTQIAIGERCVMALASGTAVRLSALPPPTPPRIKASENDKDALEIQKALWESFSANRVANGFDVGTAEHNTNGALPEAEGDDPPALDLCADKDACVLELDEAEDVETARALAKRHVNMQVFTSSLKPVLGAPPHAFTQVRNLIMQN
ncbi:unnamed protein product [Arctia plantaginis]|uniref:C2 domain-containing protein n=1 Tax=Arctia plantaginis TaxID=874455 RepID=A0A8S0ZJW9_ARCPL|nr:unnamed protein product [Arctia plantaginis]CAB3238126.1 unnamed protein product [Arctia plantaginis]